MNALPLSRKAMRAALDVLLLAFALSVSGVANAADPVKGELTVVTDGGYTRLVFRLEDVVEAKARVSGAIMVISFSKPVDVAVDRINASAPDFVSAARRDPDGTAIRIALTRKVKVNLIPAAERLYVDILPDNWKGVLPGLPQETIDDLARRARDAERQLYKQRLSEKQKKPLVTRVKVASQPTFTRYVFEMPDTANVVPERDDGKLTLNFDQQIKWDLADAKAALPATLESIEAETDFGSAAVIFTLNGAPDVRTFREDRSIVVDIGLEGARPKPDAKMVAAPEVATPQTVPAIGPPETVPAKDAAAPDQAPKVAPATPAVEAPAPAPAAKAAEVTAPKAAEAPPPKVVEAAPPKAAEVTPPKAAENPQSPSAPAAALTAAAAPEPAAPVVAVPAAPKDAPTLAAPVTPAPNPEAGVVALMNRTGSNLSVEFPFAVPTPAAVFRRADTLWLVFDSAAKINLAALTGDSNQMIRVAVFSRGEDGEGIVRVRLERPLLASLEADGPGWIVTIGDTTTAPTRPLGIARSIAGKGRSSIAIPFDDARKLHRINDPDIGDRLMVITALGPARGFLKPQDFVELRTLSSTHGVVVQPIADDIAAEIAIDKITISRPGGLSISSAALGSQPQTTPGIRSVTFDTQIWGFDREAKFNDRQAELVRLAAAAPESKRRTARLNLARFYLARDMAAEAKAVLDVTLADQRGSDDVTGSVLKAIANIMLDRPEETLKDLSNPQVGNQLDAPIWRAIAYARQGKWTEARAAFKNVDAALSALPIELQRKAMLESMRSAIEVRDFAGATRMINEFETVGVPPELEPSIAVLVGRLNEGLGRTEDALTSYRAAAASSDRRAAAQARLREIVLLFSTGDMPRQDVIHDLETLTTVWRGDETEVEGLKLLAHIYTEDNRYRDAFHTMRTAMMAHPNSDLTRKIQDEAAATFDSLFLAGKGDALPPVVALGLFYDFRELTPIGRRGDEMIRRLADRLVAVDLLDQAAELLQHQVDHRLQGAGRAQVATRLAIIYLMNRKPDRALAALQSTRSSELTNELRDERLLLEARAMSDLGRQDLALELISNIKSREAIRLQWDILWSAKRWRDAAEQIELLYAERWRDFAPLNDAERNDILRAAIGFALGEEPIGLGRLREKYAAKMADGPDGRAFDIVSAPIGTSGPEFQEIAKKVSSVDTLDTFLRDMRARYPDAVLPADATKDAGASAEPPLPGPSKGPTSNVAAPDTAGKNPPAKADAAASPLPPKAPLKPDQSPTGSISPRLPKAKTTAR
jgi:tetratricopeptide (TPR) repeat protein